jgi:hypothetical protein
MYKMNITMSIIYFTMGSKGRKTNLPTPPKAVGNSITQINSKNPGTPRVFFCLSYLFRKIAAVWRREIVFQVLGNFTHFGC